MEIKKILFVYITALIASANLHAQEDSISKDDASRIISILASDSLKGRGNFQPGILKAAEFIGNEFAKSGLQPIGNYSTYFLPFVPFGGSNKVYDSITNKNDNLPVHSSIGYNIVGMIPGKTKPAEIVLISSHYDHEGVKVNSNADAIYNGANDNASGTTAVLLLARFYALKNDNARTLLFCTFSGEELGLTGSQDFAQKMRTANIVACINLEMLGVPQYGTKSVFVTGRGFSPLYKILNKSLKQNGLKVFNDPNPDRSLFTRSDNYSFAQYGIPAHTIMASDDDEPCYHQPCDEISRIDVSNLTMIVKAIAASLTTIISGDEMKAKKR